MRERVNHLYTFIHQGLDHALLEAQQGPAAKHNDPQLAHAQHTGVNLLQHGQHLLQQIHCIPERR